MASDEESVASDYEYASAGHNTDDGSDYAVSRESTRDGFYVDDTDVMLMNGVWDGAAGARGGGRGFATFSLLTVDDLSARQAHLISEVTDLLGVDALSAKLLLRKYRWDVSTVTDNYEQAVRFLDQRKAALAEAASGCKASSRSSSKQMCGVCWDEVRTLQGLALGCGHFFCNGCLKSQFSVKINEGQSKRLSCMQPNCPEFYTEEQVLHAVDEDAGHKYIKQNVDYFVTDNPRLKFCCGPDCQMVAELRDSTAAPVVVKCACGHQWCFACASVPHFPLPCEYQRRWSERTADGGEMATVEFLKQTTKICPWCKEGVFRFDGCNFMTCRCSENFCYKCGGKVGRGVGHTWNTIDKHECGRLQGADGSSEVGDLQRFMHYLSNFKAQRQLPEDDARDRGAEREEIEDIQMVNKARRALANSYVFAFYAFEKGSAFSSRLTLFEDKQQRLEAEVEIFCRMIQDRHLKDEKRPSEVDIKSQRDKVKHWLQALHGTIHHDVLGDDAYGISIQEFDLDSI